MLFTKNGCWQQFVARMLMAIGVSIFSSVLCGKAFAQQPISAMVATAIPNPPNPAGPWIKTSVATPQCTSPPKIDGIPDDPCWQNAEHISGFYRLSSPIAQQTEAWICADSKNLYVAFHCIDTQAALIKATETQRNGNTYQDDYVGIDIDSQNTKRGYSEFVITPTSIQNQGIDGGSADNISFAGDWHGASRRLPDGWTAEMSIPFALMRYPHGAHSFGFRLKRQLARESSNEYWPYLPPESDQGSLPYFAEMTGIHPQEYKPQPIYLPYALVTAGQGESARQGMDIKYPLSSSLTALATVLPDFSTVEQDVTSINFSYTQKYINDRRPFFAEGSGFFPGGDTFYSPNIGKIDEGAKIAGKTGDTLIGMLATNAAGNSRQNAEVAYINQDFGLYDQAQAAYVADSQNGLPGTQILKLEEGLGGLLGRSQWGEQISHIGSTQEGGVSNGKDYYSLSYNEPRGHPDFGWNYTDIGPNFVNNLGYIPETDLKGSSYYLNQHNHFDHGIMQYYELDSNYSEYDHHTSGFFHNNASIAAYANTHSGYGAYYGYSQGKYEQHRDHVQEYYVEWGNKTSYAGGSIDQYDGTQEDQHYEFTNIVQGYGFSRNFNMSVNLNHLILGSEQTTQTIITGTYRIDPIHAIGLRQVSQDHNQDNYISFAQKVRTGSDIFVLFGDPNSVRTRGLITVKVVTPI